MATTKVGFTGTQRRVLVPQEQTFTHLIYDFTITDPGDILEFHHGDCVGADEMAVLKVCSILGPDDVDLFLEIHSHPPKYGKKRAHVRGYCQKYVEYPPADYLDRNQDIVNVVEWLIATPRNPERVRSGTWFTIRRAREAGIRITIIMPNGTMIEEKPPW